MHLKVFSPDIFETCVLPLKGIVTRYIYQTGVITLKGIFQDIFKTSAMLLKGMIKFAIVDVGMFSVLILYQSNNHNSKPFINDQASSV